MSVVSVRHIQESSNLEIWGSWVIALMSNKNLKNRNFLLKSTFSCFFAHFSLWSQPQARLPPIPIHILKLHVLSYSVIKKSHENLIAIKSYDLSKFRTLHIFGLFQQGSSLQWCCCACEATKRFSFEKRFFFPSFFTLHISACKCSEKQKKHLP